MTETWLDFGTGFVLGFVAYIATNLDNFLLIGGIIAGGARRRSVTTGFAIAGTLIILLASSFTILSFVVPPHLLGYVGIVPIVLGLRMLLAGSAEAGSGPSSKSGAVSIALVLFANSTDTVATFAPLFAESLAVVRLALVAGFVTSAALLLYVVLALSRRLSALSGRGALAQRIAAVVMILVGTYVLLDTGTDLE